MKKKFKLPILLLAMVIMLSIFYIKEANDTLTNPVDGDNLDISTLNPDFTEARLLGLEEASLQIKEWEALIASGDLSLAEIEETNSMINNLKDIKYQEASMEENILKLKDYDDVLVLLGEEYLVIDVYTNTEITPADFVEMAIMAKDNFGENTQIKLNTTNIME